MPKHRGRNSRGGVGKLPVGPPGTMPSIRTIGPPKQKSQVAVPALAPVAVAPVAPVAAAPVAAAPVDVARSTVAVAKKHITAALMNAPQHVSNVISIVKDAWHRKRSSVAPLPVAHAPATGGRKKRRRTRRAARKQHRRTKRKQHRRTKGRKQQRRRTRRR